jgi:hypothetical protein
MIQLGFGLPDIPDEPTPDDIAGAVLAIPGLKMDRQALVDILSSPHDVAERDIKVYAASAVTESHGALDTFVKVLEVIVAVAGGISGVTGAIAGIQSVKWK